MHNHFSAITEICKQYIDFVRIIFIKFTKNKNKNKFAKLKVSNFYVKLVLYEKVLNRCASLSYFILLTITKWINLLENISLYEELKKGL